MRKSLFLLVALMTIANFIYAGDVVTLTNGMQFNGKVKRVEKCSVTFKTQGKTYDIPATDILTVVFENPSDRVYMNYLATMADDPDACLKGKQDAQNYHGKAGLHMVLGGAVWSYCHYWCCGVIPKPNVWEKYIDYVKEQGTV